MILLIQKAKELIQIKLMEILIYTLHQVKFKEGCEHI